MDLNLICWEQVLLVNHLTPEVNWEDGQDHGRSLRGLARACGPSSPWARGWFVVPGASLFPSPATAYLPSAGSVPGLCRSGTHLGKFSPTGWPHTDSTAQEPKQEDTVKR